jgi:V8-like Glu-specific endopeptidase
MIESKTSAWLAVFALLCAASYGCGSDDQAGAQLPSFNDITTAPAAIRKASPAVVRLQTVGEVATGFFISPTGLLLTNNHVLGVEICPVEGCFVQMSLDRQRGGSKAAPVTVLAIPVSVSIGLDAAVVQLYETPGGPTVSSPSYLTLTAQDPASLVGTHVTVLGHPEGYLKKWTDGIVYDVDGDWFRTTAFSLPGDSGSPILDDSGGVVGILHRGVTGEDIIATNDVNVFSLGTASAPLGAAMVAPLPTTMRSIAANTTEDDVLGSDVVYLNAHSQTATVGGAPINIVSLLASACDKAVARQDFLSPEDLTQAMRPCYHAMNWIECRSEALSTSGGTFCPTGDDATAWTNRFQAVNQQWWTMNHQLDLFSVSFAIASLQSSRMDGTDAGALSLGQVLSAEAPPLDFLLANYLAAYKIHDYMGKNIADYVTHYRDATHYELQSTSIASAGLWLYSMGSFSRDQALSILSQLSGDPNVAVGTKLFVESEQFDFGAL